MGRCRGSLDCADIRGWVKGFFAFGVGFGGVKAPVERVGGSVWKLTARMFFSCWWGWAMLRFSVSLMHNPELR